MATNVTRITNTGNLLVNGTFDEFTGAPVIDGNVVLWLDAGQTASYSGTGSTWTDLSTNGLNGTLVNSPTFSTSPANILFNGTSQRVTFSANSAVQFLNTSPYTLEAWIYPTQIPPTNTYQGIIDRESNPGTGRDGWTFWLQGNSQASTTSLLFGAERFGLGVQNGASISVTAASTVGVWQHMITTYDGSTLRIYRNGVQLTSAAATANITNTTQTVGFASRGGAGSFFYGSISAAKIYNRALTAGEVLQNYNALAGRYGLAANTSGTALQRTTSNTVLAEQFDEVTYNTSSGVVKNLLSWSEYFTAWTVGDQSGWFYNTSPNQVTFNATAGPTPGTLAGKLIDMPAALGSQIHRIYTNSAPFSLGVTYTLSIYAKAAERTQFILFHEETAGRVGINIDLSAAAISTYSGSPANSFIKSVGNRWYRVGFTFTATQTGNSVLDICRMKDALGNPTYVGDGTSGMYLWGAQLEASSSATIYQGNGARATPIVFGSSAAPLTPAFSNRIDSLGGIYTTNIFDEFTGAPVVNGNLKVWLDAGQTTSYPGTGSTWTDLSGTSNNLTLTSSPTFNSTLGGGAVTFNGSTSYAVKTTASGIPSGASPFTLSIWFYPTSSATAMRVVAYGTENTGQLVSIRINAGGAYAVTFAHWGGAGYDVGNGSTVNGNAWNNVTEVFDGTNDYMYINGTLVGTFTPSTLNISANSDLYVGKRATGEFFAGSVGQVMVYNRALSADEISNNYNALKRRYGLS